jgi:hypothetical protein
LQVLDQLYSPTTCEKEDLEKERMKVVNIMESSKDELFHDSWFKWYISKGMENELLKIQTPFPSNKTKRLELLSRDFLENKKYEKAALLLLKLVESESESIDLSKEWIIFHKHLKCKYLLKMMNCCKIFNQNWKLQEFNKKY